MRLIGLAGIVLALAVFYTLRGPEPPDRLPDSFAAASRLILVETADFHTSAATLRTFERDAAGDWREAMAAVPAQVGKAGLGWGHTFRHLATAGEPIKREGDKRAPSGLFRLGAPFGFAPGDGGYLQLAEGRHFCVDDADSARYSEIVPQASVPEGTSGEKMWAIDLYTRGIVVDYPTDRVAKSGSCIFVHVWKSPETPTVGCVAADEATVARLQDWAAAAPGGAWIAIVPEGAAARVGLRLGK